MVISAKLSIWGLVCILLGLISISLSFVFFHRSETEGFNLIKWSRSMVIAEFKLHSPWQYFVSSLICAAIFSLVYVWEPKVWTDVVSRAFGVKDYVRLEFLIGASVALTGLSLLIFGPAKEVSGWKSLFGSGSLLKFLDGSSNYVSSITGAFLAFGVLGVVVGEPWAWGVIFLLPVVLLFFRGLVGLVRAMGDSGIPYVSKSGCRLAGFGLAASVLGIFILNLGIEG